jgi:glycosyltransferase involved in cell wall biosynthesis
VKHIYNKIHQKGGGKLKVLLSYIVPSGGMETLNRSRGEKLRENGVDCQLLYGRYGAGLQNISSCPTHISDIDHDIYLLLRTEGFQAAVVSSDYLMLERLRGFGFTGPIIFEVQGLGQMDYANQFVNDAAPYILAYADALLYPPTAHLVQLFARFPTKLHFSFPNCVDTIKFQYSEHAATPPIIGWVGRLEANKNWRECLEIVYRIALHEPQLRLWIFEDSNLSSESERAAFHDMILHLGLGQRIDHFCNAPNSDMPHYYSVIGESGGFLLSSSILEGFGYAVAEAMSCRCPVLSTDSDGVRAFIIPNVTGKFYPQGNIEAAVQEGLELMNPGSLRDSIRLQGRAHIESVFSTDTYFTNFIGMLHRLGVQ